MLTSSLVIIDSAVEEKQLLIDAIISQTPFICLSPENDGVEQIVEAQKQYCASAISLIAHGSPGEISLGKTKLSLDSLSAYESQLKGLFQGCADQASLALYCCNVAAGDAGEEFINKLNQYTGAVIHASTRKVGNANLGGNWALNTSNCNGNFASVDAQNQSPFLSENLTAYTGILIDTDNDGVDDDIDIDDDNDGILDITEAQITPTSGTVGVNDPFPVDVPGFFQVINNAVINGVNQGAGRLFAYNPFAQTYTPLGSVAPGFSVNAISYDPTAEAVIGVAQGSGTDAAGNAIQADDLVKYDRDGEVFLIGRPTANWTRTNAAEFYNGNAYIRTDSNEITVVDVNQPIGSTNDPTILTFTLSSNASVDFAAIGSTFYQIVGSSLRSFDVAGVSDGDTLTVNSVAVSGLPSGTYGAGWHATDPATGNTELYFSNNATGAIYRIEDFNTPTPTATFVLQGIPTGSNDGAGAFDVGAPFVQNLLDSDGDGIPNHLDIDSDDDGITDNIEAQSTADFIAPSGTGAGITDLNGNGLDDAYEVAPGTAGFNPDGIGLLPVNSDGIDETDYLDSDSDNDGTSDTDENGLGVAQVAPTDADTDGDGLKDAFETAIDGNVNDGFVVSEGITDPLNTPSGYLPDAGGDASVGTATPLINDLDFRDLNDDPVAVDDSFITSEDTTSIPLNLVGNDTDADGDTLSITSIAGTTLTPGTAQSISVPNGTVDVDAAGNITFTPDADYNGPVTFDYVISDGNGGTDIGTVNGTVTPVNDPPVAVDDSFTTSEDTTSTPLNLVSNDTDLDGDMLSVTSIAGTTLTPGTAQSISVPNGTVEVDAAGNITFTPDADYNGPVTFDYVISDGNGGTDIGTVNGTVTPVNDPPVAVDDSFTTSEDTTSTPLNLVGNDTDLDGDMLSVTSIAGTTLTPGTAQSISVPNGTVDVDAAGNITFTPDADYNGPVTFDYVISDGNGGTDIGTVNGTVTPVNDPPVAVDDSFTTSEDTTSTPLNLVGNDTDLDGDMLSVTSIAGTTLTPGTAQSISVPNGTVEVDAAGNITFTPDADYNGPVTFDYVVSDGNGGTDTGTVSGIVTPVNDAPTAVDDSASTTEDSTRIINLTNNDTDPDVGDDLEILNIDTTGTVGTVTINPNDESVVYDPNGQYESLAVGETATDTFTYTVSDGNGGTDTATVTVTITGTNDGPVATDDGSFPVTEDTPATGNVLGNDTDIDGDSLVVTEFTIPGVPGSITAGNPASIPGVGTLQIDANGDFTFTPAPDYNGPVPVATYTISDGNGGTDTADLSFDPVTPVNDAPTAVDDSATTPEDSSRIINLTNNDTDPDVGDDLEILNIDTTGTVGTVTINPNDDSVVYDPNGQYENLAVGETATDTFTYTVSDGNGGTDTATVTVTITGTNDGPTAVDDAATTAADNDRIIDLTGNDTDPDVSDDLEILNIDTTGTVGNVSINPNDDSVVYDPNGQYDSLAVGETATDTFTYTVSDGNGGTDTATTTVTIVGRNDAPTAVDDSATTAADNSRIINLTNNDTDPDVSDDLEILNIDTTGTLGTVSINPNDDSVVYDPNGQYDSLAVGETATDTFTYTVSDGNGGTDTATVTVTIVGRNDTPIATDDGPIPVTEDTPATGNVLGNDTDVDGDPLVVTEFTIPGVPGSITAGNPASIPGVGTLQIDANGDFTFTPAPDYNGPVPVATYTISDGNGGTDTADLNLGPVTPVNDVPTAVNDNVITAEDNSRIINLTVNDTDPDVGDDLEILNIDTAGTLGTVSINPNDDSVIYDPNGQFDSLAVGETATDTFTYTVSDGNGGTDTATATVTIVGRNDAPTAVNDNVTTAEDNARIINLTGNDTDPNASDDLEILSIDTAGTLGTVSINPNDDTVNYDPNGQFDGLAVGETATDTFTYTISDGNGGTDTATATVTIIGRENGPNTLGTQNPDFIEGTDQGDLISGFSDKDTLIGGGGDDTINGGSSSDLLEGGIGNDILNGGSNDDFVLGQSGKDTLTGGSGNDTLNGGLDDDILLGSSGRDLLVGSLGNDALLGGNNNDTLIGGAGADNLQGGQGADVFRYRSFSEFGDVITDFAILEDLIDVSGIFQGSGSFSTNIDLIQSGNNTVVRVSDGGMTDTLGVLLDVNENTLDASNFNF